MLTNADFVTLLDGVEETGAGDPLAVDGLIGGATVFELVLTDTATVTWQAAIDGRNWYSIQAERLDTGDFAATAAASGLYRVEGTGIGALRPNVTAYTSGTVTVRARSQLG